MVQQIVQFLIILFILGILIWVLFRFSQETLNKFKLIAEIILILAGVYFGNVITTSLKNKELDLQILKLAVGVIGEKPSEEQEPLRLWAIEAFEKFADPKPSSEVIEMLKKYPAKGFIMTQERVQEMWNNDPGYQKAIEAEQKVKELSEALKNNKSTN